jgi:phospholipase C
VSFDHYFGTYPNATNPAGEPPFTTPPGPPAVDGLQGLLVGNPNGADPQRIDRTQPVTCDQDHGYADEQAMFNNGLMDKFVAVARDQQSCTPPRGKNIVMDYYDGNTVTALWNLAAHFSLSDRFYGSTFGPSTPGALNLIAGQTHSEGAAGSGIENGTIIGDPDPAFDDCGGRSATMTGLNIGDLLNTAGVTWGWFQGGFRNCGEVHAGVPDYSPHHEPFMYYQSTANPHHLPPSSVQRSARPTRPTTSTTWPTSTAPCAPATCRACPS